MSKTRFDHSDSTTTDPRAMLLESAPVAERLSKNLCRTDPETGITCAWNHGTWQYLRLLNMITTPDLHAAFFHQSLSLPQPENPRILISGTADYGMLEKLREAFSGRDTPPNITVLDRCQTPLELCKWYASRTSMQISCRCVDILDYDEYGSFDLICTDSFIAQFDRKGRELLLRQWTRLLRLGGRIVTVNRIRPHTEGPVRFSAEQIALFTRAVEMRLPLLRGVQDIDPSNITRLAEQYALHQTTHAVSSEQELQELFEQSGLALTHWSRSTAPGSGNNCIAGPTIPDHSEYACLVAVLD